MRRAPLAMTCAVAGAVPAVPRLRATYTLIRIDGHRMNLTLADGDRVLTRRVSVPALRRVVSQAGRRRRVPDLDPYLPKTEPTT